MAKNENLRIEAMAYFHTSKQIVSFDKIPYAILATFFNLKSLLLIMERFDEPRQTDDVATLTFNLIPYFCRKC